MRIRLPIDTKSLYLNIQNDNEKGHTATVATPLRQGHSVREELMPIFDIPENIDAFSRENFVGKILAKSRAEAKIVRVCVFDKISVNGTPLEGTPSFCLYVREETSPDNVHFGRQKMHYPITLKYSDEDTEINNKQVIKAVSEALHNYAFIVEAFEYDTISCTLNFVATIVGARDIPYSKVFINHKGVGNKFAMSFSEDSDLYDVEVIALRDKLGYENVTPENYTDVVSANKETAFYLAEQYLHSIGGIHVRNLCSEYPYALYDFEYDLHGRKNYLIVKQTATKNGHFHLSTNRIQFLNDFEERVDVMLITDILGAPQIALYTLEELNSMTKRIVTIFYEVGENNG